MAGQPEKRVTRQVSTGRSAGRVRSGLLDRVQARLAGRARLSAGFAPGEDAVGPGNPARGARLVAGQFRLAGHEVSLASGTLWSVPLPPDAEDARQSFAWLDDLAAAGDAMARARAQVWVRDWMRRYGRGQGPGWQAEVTGARVMHWLGQGRFLARGLPEAEVAQTGRCLARQVLFLARRWQAAPEGLPRLTALAGLVEGAATFETLAHHRGPALVALGRHCEAVIDADGAIASRNPQALCDILTLLNRVCRRAAVPDIPPAIEAARQRIAPVLRALRHADGRLARFHGGGRGRDGALDAALAASGSRARHEGLAMGYARLAAGRSTVIMDAAPPPRGLSDAHAATLAFELTSGRRPLIVNCGSGAGFGAQWTRAARATASQSVLGLDGFSSARLGPGGDERLSEAPDTVPGEAALTATSHRMGAAHNGWQRTHGLMYARTLDLTLDGRALTGEELLIALDAAEQAVFARARADTGGGVAFSIRFHLHPEVEASLGERGDCVILSLKSGEVWMLRQDGAEAISLRPSVWLEPGRTVPRPTQQVVLSGRAIDYATRVRWSLAKTPGTPNALRDPGPDPEEDE
ncbi:MAG: heparinase II/III family protein [Rubellimicrobium sp.]|nr:heparinase II/III family protein [Rubellimicrobium sp.]